MLEMIVPLGYEQRVKQHVDLFAEQCSLFREEIEQVLTDFADEVDRLLEQ